MVRLDWTPRSPSCNSQLAVSKVAILFTLIIAFVPWIQAAAVSQYDSSFDRLFQFSSYCQNRPECYRRSDGSVILTLHGYSAGGMLWRVCCRMGAE